MIVTLETGGGFQVKEVNTGELLNPSSPTARVAAFLRAVSVQKDSIEHDPFRPAYACI